MREDDFEDYRRISPIWQRIMILLAVIAAVPVVLWSITVIVRAYVAPPKVPVFKPLAVTASAQAPDTTSSIAPATSAAAQPPAVFARSVAVEEIKPPAAKAAPIVEARATTSDARDPGPAPAPTMAPVAAPAPFGKLKPRAFDTPPPVPAPVRPPVVEADATVTDQSAPAQSPAPWPGASAAPRMVQQMPAAAMPAADDLPAGAPLTGRIPLPPHRPRVFAMAQGGIPVPRPRPSAAGEASATPAPDVNMTSHDYMR